MSASTRWRERVDAIERAHADAYAEIETERALGTLTPAERTRQIGRLVDSCKRDLAMAHTVYQLGKAAEDMRAQFQV